MNLAYQERFMRKGDGTIYGYFDEQGVAHFDESVMNGNTAIHEFGHPWQDWCKRTNPKLYERGVELINESPYIDEVRKEAQDPDSVYYGMSEEQMVDEAIARAIGDKGEKMLEKHGVFKFAQLRDWLAKLWQSLKQKFGVGLNENLEDMTLDEFTTIASRDILGGEKLHDKATGTDFTHEELSIIDTAKRDGTHMKAPNGKPTKLTEKQWAQVRTKAFKEWFGDWEKATRIEKLRKAKAIEITGEEIAPSDDLKQYKKNALDYGKALRGEYTNKDTGAKVLLAKNALKEVLQHDYKDVEQLQSIVAIPKIIEESIYIDSEKNNDSKIDADAFDYYVSGLKIGGVDYTVRSVIVKLKDGTRYYDHKLTQIEKGKLIDSLVGTTPGFNQTESPVSVDKDKRLVSILQTNCSKVVDENGEPMVVYHGTLANGLHKFNKDFIGSRYSYDDKGFFFISRESIAKDYATSEFDATKKGEVIPAFISLQNPLVVDAVWCKKNGLGSNVFKDNDVIEFWDNYQSLMIEESEGKDGVVITDGTTAMVVVFDPTQIKSATSNVGTFDGRNADIRYQQVKNDSQERDEDYRKAVEAGDMETAQKMLAEEAERKGYTTESDYQGTLAFNGAAPSSNAYYETKAERKEAWDNGDYEGDWSLADELVHGMEMGDLEHRISAREMRRYDDMRRESAQSIRNVRAKLQAGEKNVKIKLYRSVPVGVKEKELRNGDWVTPSKSYAEYHIGLQDWDKGRVIEQEVPIEDVWWDGNDIAEWGYDNGKEEAYKNTPNNRKAFEITYDKKGNLIPLSERFDEAKNDVLYRLGDDADTFDARKKAAVANKGTVMPGLNGAQVKVVEVPRHGYKGHDMLTQAVHSAIERYNTREVDNSTGKEVLKPIAQHYDNHGAKFDYEITVKSIKNVTNHQSASENVGVHVAVMDKLDEVIGNSIEVEEHPDVLKKDGKREWKNGFSDNVLIHRFIGAVKIDGTLYRVKTTMKEYRGADIANKPYTYEVTKIEVLDKETPNTPNGTPISDIEYLGIAKLLKGVEKSYEKGKKLLEESKKGGGPRFGYIGYSMSERAHQARMEGRYPKTDFKKEYDMPQPTLDALVQAGVIDGSEWHHTSKAYNKTTFYGWNDEACIATYKAHKAEIDAWAKGIDPSTGEALPAVDDTNPYHRHDTMPQGSEGRAIEDKVSGKYYDEMEEVARKYENDDKKRHDAIAEIAKRKDEARSAKIRNEV